MSLSKKVKTALDETRLLILGAQVLFGFQLNGVFQEAFSGLSRTTRLIDCAGQVLMALSLGLLIAPSMQHRIVENGEDTLRIHRVTGLFAGLALLPFEISLGLGVYIIFDHLYGVASALVAGTVFCLLAGVFWFGLEFAMKWSIGTTPMREQEKPTPLPTKVDQMLTEARVIIPGGQALLGFQLTVTLTRAFEQLPAHDKLLHVAALCCVALAVILLMTPAALHRITFAGEDTQTFFRMGSAFVIAAPVPLALGIAGDLYVATAKASESPALAAVLAAIMFVVLAFLWYGLPLYLRARESTR
jgi:hypothetical protein